MKTTVGVIVALLLAAIAGCNVTDPCSTLAPPTPGQVAAAAEGAEVEKEVTDDIECVVDGNTWVRDSD